MPRLAAFRHIAVGALANEIFDTDIGEGARGIITS